MNNRIELSPACDLWMRGARYGTVIRTTKSRHTSETLYHVKMDHPLVKHTVRVTDAMIQRWID